MLFCVKPTVSEPLNCTASLVTLIKAQFLEDLAKFLSLSDDFSVEYVLEGYFGSSKFLLSAYGHSQEIIDWMVSEYARLAELRGHSL